VVAVRASSGDIRERLDEGSRGQSGGRGSHRLRFALAAGQVAMTLVLLVGAGLLARSFLRLSSVNPGYRTGGALVMDILIPWANDEQETARSMRFHEELITRLAAIPGVRQVGSVNILPLGDGGEGSSGTFLKINGTEVIRGFEDYARLAKEPGRSGDASYRVASAGYFRAMGIPLIRGRLFDDRDVADSTHPHAAVVSRSLAEANWPGGDPVGQMVQYGGMDGDMRPFVIVGVVGDVREQALDAEPRPTFYANVRQRPAGVNGPHDIVMLGGDPDAVSATARRILREMNPEIPVRFRTLEEVFSASLSARRFSMVLLGIFAVTALVLAVTGIYGIVSYLVKQRTREIGIRLALGAPTGTVLRMVLRSGLLLAAAGVAAGLLVALASTRLLSGLLYGIGATDPVTFVAVPLLLIAVAAVAAYIPARRTTRVDPIIAMRTE
jgi:putative ABC transport system permease protein